MKNKKNKNANLENKRSTFFLIGLVLTLGAVLYAFEWKTGNSNKAEEFVINSIPIDEDVYIPPTPNKDRIVLPPKVEVPTFNIVDDNDDIENEFFVNSGDPDEIDLNLDDLVFVSGAATPKEEKEEEIPYIVQFMPEFPGGQKALLSFLSKNVNYPVIAQENGVQGKVYVTFIIDEKGRVTSPTILRGEDESLNREAIRVVSSMPNWKPGRQQGKAVKVRFNVPIHFQLQ